MRDSDVGEKIDQYQLTELLARSGMASIFKGIDTETGATVALKIPHVQFESDIVFSQRFEREVEVGQRLDHPNIVRVLKPKSQTRVYLPMEFVEGTSLRAMMKEKEPLPTEKALDIARQVCEAVEYLHSQGVVHRDIKPENILLTPSGQVKILDFGIALVASERRLTWTGFSNTLGTPDYMAPEQIRGGAAIRAPTCTPWGSCSTRCSPATFPTTAPTRARSCGPRRARSPARRPTTCPASPPRSRRSSSAPSSATPATATAAPSKCSPT